MYLKVVLQASLWSNETVRVGDKFTLAASDLMLTMVGWGQRLYRRPSRGLRSTWRGISVRE